MPRRRRRHRRPPVARFGLLLAGGVALLAALALHRPGRAVAPPERLPGTPPPAVIVQREPLSVAQLLEGRRDVVEISVSDIAIAPAELQAKAGVELHLRLRNRGRREHNFLIPEFGIVTQPMPPGGENYVAFTPSHPGSFPYFSGDPRARTPEPCAVNGAAGCYLQGTLRVSP